MQIVIVRVWYSNEKNGKTGHVSLELDSGHPDSRRYISFYPKNGKLHIISLAASELTNLGSKQGEFPKEKENIEERLKHDRTCSDGSYAHESIAVKFVNVLDSDAICNAIDRFVQSNLDWRILGFNLFDATKNISHNCSTLVLALLKIGGISNCIHKNDLQKILPLADSEFLRALSFYMDLPNAQLPIVSGMMNGMRYIGHAGLEAGRAGGHVSGNFLGAAGGGILAGGATAAVLGVCGFFAATTPPGLIAGGLYAAAIASGVVKGWDVGGAVGEGLGAATGVAIGMGVGVLAGTIVGVKEAVADMEEKGVIITPYVIAKLVIHASQMQPDNIIIKSAQQNISLRLPGLRYQQIPGDGHCLYNAVGMYLNRTQELLREDVALYLERNLGEFGGFIERQLKQSPQDYIAGIRKGKEWAAHVEIEILMKIFGRPIAVIGPNGRIQDLTVLERYNAEPIFVFYNGHDHYDAFLRTEEISNQEILRNLIQFNENSLIISNDKLPSPPTHSFTR